jgi:tRNA pseudouridine55 synthase
MASRRRTGQRERPGPAGFLVVDKPGGWTSHDVVDAARKWLGTRRVGHLGTLDPQATGVLPLAIREATKLIPFLDDADKSYRGVVHLGVETDTLDAEGTVTRTHEGELPDEAKVSAALAQFRGDIEQIPPMYSAVKQNGVPLHRLARQGTEVDRAAKKVRIHRLELVRFDSPEAELLVECSQGTYVRTLAADLGEGLGCGASLRALRRLRSGPFQESDAHSVEELGEAAQAGTLEAWFVPCVEALGMRVFELAPEPLKRLLNGGDISPGTGHRLAVGMRAAAVDPEGQLVAIVELRPDRRLWPLRVLPRS